MIETSDAFKAKLFSENNAPQLLVSMHLRDETSRVTDAPYVVFFEGREFESQTSLQAISIPPFDGKVDRNKLTFVLIDHDSKWYNLINRTGLGSIAEIHLVIEDDNGQLLPDAVLLYKGRISSVSTRTRTRGRSRSKLTSVYCTGPFHNLDATTIRRTTHSSQQQVASGDTFFIDSFNSENPSLLQW